MFERRTFERRLRLTFVRIRFFWQRYKENRRAVIGLFIIFSLIIIAFAAPILTHNPWEISKDRFCAPSLSHPMGTDDLGRDIFAGILYGSKVSLMVGFAVAVISMAIGVLVGSISGYVGGVIDDLLMRITELFFCIPRFFLAVVLVAIFGATIWNIIFALGILSWPVTARITRAECMRLKDSEFVIAAKAVGVSDREIIFSEILPNVMGPLIVNASLLVVSSILVEAGLSFLGLGDPELISWGYMLKNAAPYLRIAWWLPIFPGLAIFFMTLSLNFIGDGLNDALNPRLRERGE